VRLLLFDLDGTLLRATHRPSPACRVSPFAAAMQEVFGVAIDGHGVRFDGKTDPLIIAELLARASAPRAGANGPCAPALPAPDRLRAFEACLATRLDAALACDATRVHALPGVPAVLERLAADPGLALGVLTGNLEQIAHRKLRAAGLARFFAVGAFGSDDAHRAALPAVACARFRAHSGHALAPADCVIIGDTPLDHAAAAANAMPCVLIASGRTPFAELAALRPAAVFPDWSDAAALHAALAAP